MAFFISNQYGAIRKTLRAARSSSYEELENWRTGELENWRTGELENWRTGELENWRTGELENWRT
ncbi:hypothetical protein, partial [Vibrio tubiashii]